MCTLIFKTVKAKLFQLFNTGRNFSLTLIRKKISSIIIKWFTIFLFLTEMKSENNHKSVTNNERAEKLLFNESAFTEYGFFQCKCFDCAELVVPSSDVPTGSGLGEPPPLMIFGELVIVGSWSNW